MLPTDDFYVATLEERIKQLEQALYETAQCLEDVAAGKWGWAWEEVICDARALLE